MNFDIKPDNIIVESSTTRKLLLGDVETFIRQFDKPPKVHGTFCYHHPLFYNGNVDSLDTSSINGFNIDAAAIAHTMYWIIFQQECQGEIRFGADLNLLFSNSQLPKRVAYIILELTAQYKQINRAITDLEV